MGLYCVVLRGFVLSCGVLFYVVVCGVVLFCADLFCVVVNCAELYIMVACCLVLYNVWYWIGLDLIVLDWLVLSCRAMYFDV